MSEARRRRDETARIMSRYKPLTPTKSSKLKKTVASSKGKFGDLNNDGILSPREIGVHVKKFWKSKVLDAAKQPSIYRTAARSDTVSPSVAATRSKVNKIWKKVNK